MRGIILFAAISLICANIHAQFFKNDNGLARRLPKAGLLTVGEKNLAILLK